MAITIVASVVATSADGADVTLVFDGSQENDVAVVMGGFAGGTATAPGVISPSGYSSIWTVDSGQLDTKLEWKRLDSNPDASVLCAGSGNAADSTGYVGYVLRGVSTDASPFDATTVTSIASGTPQSPSIITVTDGAIVLALAANDVFDSTPGVVNNFDANMSGSSNDNDDITVAGAASILSTAGTIAPDAWSTWAGGTYNTATVALAPYVAPPAQADPFQSYVGAFASLPQGVSLGGFNY